MKFIGYALLLHFALVRWAADLTALPRTCYIYTYIKKEGTKEAVGCRPHRTAKDLSTNATYIQEHVYTYIQGYALAIFSGFLIQRLLQIRCV